MKRFIDALRPHKTIPITPWSASHRWDLSISRVSILTFGLFIFGIGDSLIIISELGNAPWSVLAQGVATKSDISIGSATFLISCLVLLLWIPLKEKPGFGTLANIVVSLLELMWELLSLGLLIYLSFNFSMYLLALD